VYVPNPIVPIHDVPMYVVPNEEGIHFMDPIFDLGEQNVL